MTPLPAHAVALPSTLAADSTVLQVVRRRPGMVQHGEVSQDLPLCAWSWSSYLGHQGHLRRLPVLTTWQSRIPLLPLWPLMRVWCRLRPVLEAYRLGRDRTGTPQGSQHTSQTHCDRPIIDVPYAAPFSLRLLRAWASQPLLSPYAVICGRREQNVCHARERIDIRTTAYDATEGTRRSPPMESSQNRV